MELPFPPSNTLSPQESCTEVIFACRRDASHITETCRLHLELDKPASTISRRLHTLAFGLLRDTMLRLQQSNLAIGLDNDQVQEKFHKSGTYLVDIAFPIGCTVKQYTLRVSPGVSLRWKVYSSAQILTTVELNQGTHPKKGAAVLPLRNVGTDDMVPTLPLSDTIQEDVSPHQPAPDHLEKVKTAVQCDADTTARTTESFEQAESPKDTSTITATPEIVERFKVFAAHRLPSARSTLSKSMILFASTTKQISYSVKYDMKMKTRKYWTKTGGHRQSMTIIDTWGVFLRHYGLKIIGETSLTKTEIASTIQKIMTSDKNRPNNADFVLKVGKAFKTALATPYFQFSYVFGPNPDEKVITQQSVEILKQSRLVTDLQVHIQSLNTTIHELRSTVEQQATQIENQTKLITLQTNKIDKLESTIEQRMNKLQSLVEKFTQAV